MLMFLTSPCTLDRPPPKKKKKKEKKEEEKSSLSALIIDQSRTDRTVHVLYNVRD